ncbi:MAG: tail fiber domain-containing protein [Chloroflexota bacterium]|nr:MAG: tail fiber domain-containing protein [Chloroflexota bacterium]
MRRFSLLFSIVLCVVFFLILTGAVVRSDWSPQIAANQASSAVGTAFTYQGYLTDGGAPADGAYDFLFVLYDDEDAGSQLGPSIEEHDLPVREGFFTVDLDFERDGDTVFDGTALWLEIQVRPGENDSDPYSTLAPRQSLAPTPHAIYASRASWNGLIGVPFGFADGVDDDTTYAAGPGLVLSDTTFAISATYQLPQSCIQDQVATWSGTGWSCSDVGTGTAGWSLSGNAGTTPGPNYLGTSDDRALELRVNGQRALRLEPGADSPSFVAGYGGNSISPAAVGATVGGGGRDLATNQADGDYSTVDGGAGNTAGGYASTVGGGEGNSAGGNYAIVGGGISNTTTSNYTAIGGGQDNSTSAVGATVSGGQGNEASGAYGGVSSGAVNSAAANFAAVGGGYYNAVGGAYGTVAGGGPSDLGNPTTSNNQVYDDYGVVSGGGGNVAGSDDGDPAASVAATVGGGIDNAAGATYATIGGGHGNSASSDGATVGGGDGNSATNQYATVAGGTFNSAGGANATVAGGKLNVAGQRSATVGGGESNIATGAFATIGGGSGNQVAGNYGAIPGGVNNYVGANYGFAAGFQARAEHEGSFVWSDSTPDIFVSTGPDQFLIQAAGGVGIGTNAAIPTRTLTVGGSATILGEGRLAARGVVTGTDEFDFAKGLQEPSAIDSAGNYIYVTAGATNTLTIIDVSDPDHPRPINYTTSDLHQPIDVQVAGGLAFVASELSNRLVIIDVSDPSNLRSIGSSDRLLAKPQAVHVVGNHAYVASHGENGTGLHDGLAIFDVSDPTEPLNRDFADANLEGTSDVFVAGDYAYVASQDNDRLVSFDISDPDNIVAKGYVSDFLVAPTAVQVRGNYAYVLGGGSHNLIAYDIRVPDSMAYVGQASTSLRQPESFYLAGDDAYVAFAGEPGTGAHSGLVVFDVSDPAAIQVLSVIDMSDSQPSPEKPVAIAGSGRHVYVANEAHHSVTIYDVNHLAAPAVTAGVVRADTLESLGDTQVNNNLSVGNGLNVGPGGTLIEGQLSVAGRDDNYILGNLSLGAAGLVHSDTEKTQVMYPTQQLDVHGDARFRVNDNHSLMMASPPTKGAFFDFTSNTFGAYYTPTARIEFFVPDPFTGTTHTTEVKILTQSASDDQVRGRVTIGEEIVFHHVDPAEPDPELNLRTTITLTKNGHVLPGADAAYTLGDEDDRWAAVFAANGTIQTSDGRWKENVSDLEAGLNEIRRLRPVTFNWIGNPEDGQHYGLIAQELAEVLPEIVAGGGDAGQPLGMNYAEMVPVLVNAVQEQQAQIESQADQIASLEARLSALEKGRDGPGMGPALGAGSNLFWLGGMVFLVVIAAVGGRRRLGGRS